MGNQITRLSVDLGDRSYPILISDKLLTNNALSGFFEEHVRGNRVCIVTNETVAPLYLSQIQKSLAKYQCDVVILPDGEQYKTLNSIERILTALLEQQQNRTLSLIALGGGVIGDMTGFAAACYQRGVDFIQVPTTLLSQVDSSVGGKTGVNHPLGKNMIGAFKQPTMVLIDTHTLSTLPDRDFSAGMAEVIKYGLIWDAEFFNWLELNAKLLSMRDVNALSYAIAKSCAIKSIVVAEDETEQGIRAILNLGHTFGHAIETHTGYGSWLHGEAVATGMLMAVEMSHLISPDHVPETVITRLQSLLSEFNLPMLPPEDMTKDTFLKHMAVDKKNLDGVIRLVLIEKLGRAFVTQGYPQETLNATFEKFVNVEPEGA